MCYHSLHPYSCEAPLATDFNNPEAFPALIARYSPEKVIVLRATGSHHVSRLVCRDNSYVLKQFQDPSTNRESILYNLLGRYAVPTLQVYENTGLEILLEDLGSSRDWRLAEAADMHSSATGEALAVWYRRLHAAGQKALADPDWPELGVQPWVAAITPQALTRAGKIFQLDDSPTWKATCARAPGWIASYLSLPQTFNYNDFAAENLALSRAEDPMRAIVFDYDCFATGCAASDWRNVTFGLDGAAREAFINTYGPVSSEALSLDQPLSILYSLVIASRRERTPAWAAPLIESVWTGEVMPND